MWPDYEVVEFRPCSGNTPDLDSVTIIMSYLIPAPPLSTVFCIIIFFPSRASFRPPHPPPFNWASPLFRTLLSLSLPGSDWTYIWTSPPPSSLHRLSQIFSSLLPLTWYPVSLSALEVLRHRPISSSSSPVRSPPPFLPSTRRAYLSVPVGFTFSRSILLPQLPLSAPLTCLPRPST